MDKYENVEDRKKQVKGETNLQQRHETTQEYMNNKKTLTDCKSLGSDKVTNDMLKHLETKAKNVLLEIYNSSWESGLVPQAWRKAHM